MMRAKIKITSIKKWSETQEDLNFSAVCANQFDAEGNDENNTYAKWTPNASLSMTITNPALIGKFSEGQEFYIDFTLIK